jgi:RNA polymerase sigma-70 factor (ECF subfamily)
MNTNDTRGPGNQPLASLSDAELVERFKRGDREAFTALHRRHAAWLGYQLLLRCRCESTAEDLQQEVWIRFNKVLDSRTVRGDVRALLGHIARRVAASHFRTTRGPKGGLVRLMPAACISTQPAKADPDQLEALELLEWIESQLNKVERVIVNKLMEGMPQRSIAASLGKADGATRVKILRLRRKLAKLLNKRERS